MLELDETSGESREGMLAELGESGEGGSRRGRLVRTALKLTLTLPPPPPPPPPPPIHPLPVVSISPPRPPSPPLARLELERSRAAHEKKHNVAHMKRVADGYGSILHYGAVVQLQHMPSGLFVAASESSALRDMDNRKVGRAHSCATLLRPHYTQHTRTRIARAHSRMPVQHAHAGG